MSIRAYLVNEDVKIIDGKRYVHEDLEYLWNNWGESEIWDALYDYINDMTNDDCVGIIELVSDSWEELKEDYIKCSEQNKENRFCKTINKHKEVFQKLDEYFKKGNQWATIKLL